MGRFRQALEAYAAWRRPRVSWAHQQSDGVAQSFLLPAATHDTALRQHGDEMLERRFAPLLAAPIANAAWPNKQFSPL